MELARLKVLYILSGDNLTLTGSFHSSIIHLAHWPNATKNQHLVHNYWSLIIRTNTNSIKLR